MFSPEMLGIVARRFGESVMTCWAVSALLRKMQSAAHLRETEAIHWLLYILAGILFLIINSVLMRRCRFVIGGNPMVYLVSNVAAWVLYLGLHLLLLTVFGKGNLLYNYLYRITRIWELAGCNGWVSAIISDVILLLLIPLSQYGMGPILREAENEISSRYE